MELPDFLAQDDQGLVHFRGHRIGIHNILFYYRQGYSPEMLACKYDTLSLSLVHKLIAFYLENREQADEYLNQCQAQMGDLRAAHRSKPTVEELRERMASLQKA